MKILSILAISLLLGACALKHFPNGPDVKKHYLVEVRNEPITLHNLEFIEDVASIPLIQQHVRCLEFDVLSWHPYKIKFSSEMPMVKCNLTGGYAPSDVQKILNWVDDVYVWAKDRKRCIKL